jgi:hypothetical protein
MQHLAGRNLHDKYKTFSVSASILDDAVMFVSTEAKRPVYT